WHDGEEHHDRAVHRAELCVELRQHDAAGRVGLTEQSADDWNRMTWERELPADQQDEQEAEQEKNEAREEVLQADNFVVGRNNSHRRRRLILYRRHTMEPRVFRPGVLERDEGRYLLAGSSHNAAAVILPRFLILAVDGLSASDLQNLKGRSDNVLAELEHRALIFARVVGEVHGEKMISFLREERDGIHQYGD